MRSLASCSTSCMVVSDAGPLLLLPPSSGVMLPMHTASSMSSVTSACAQRRDTRVCIGCRTGALPATHRVLHERIMMRVRLHYKAAD
jgi:hypothetical protein